MHKIRFQSQNRSIETIHKKLQINGFVPALKNKLYQKLSTFTRVLDKKGRLNILSLSNKELNYQPSTLIL